MLPRFEKKYDPVPVLEWMRDHPIVPILAVTAYAVLIFGGQYLMKDRPAWNLRGIMALWNLSLSVFSWVGMFRTAPQLLHNLYYSSLRDNLCLDREFILVVLCPSTWWWSWHSEKNALDLLGFGFSFLFSVNFRKF